MTLARQILPGTTSSRAAARNDASSFGGRGGPTRPSGTSLRSPRGDTGFASTPTASSRTTSIWTWPTPTRSCH